MKREFFGTSVEDALQRAGNSFGVEAQQLKYSVVTGEFGRCLGTRRVAILVEVPGSLSKKTREESTSDETPPGEPGSAEWARYVLEGIFRMMGVFVKVSSKEKAENVIVTVDLPDGTLDLRRGESRELRGAVQHLINRAASAEGEKEKRFIVDIGGTLEKRRDKVNAVARQLADKVSVLGHTIHVHLMDSQDRRIVHAALAEDRAVSTDASGEAQFRILRVEPKKAR